MNDGSATVAWLKLAEEIRTQGEFVAPRGQLTRETLHGKVVVDMTKPIVMIPERKLQTKFLGGEAYWILSGDNKVENIAPYNSHITAYSDDGIIFAGAYGPMIINQWGYVFEKLLQDPDTRQATLTIWKPNPEPSKDIPCTVAINFQIRASKLHAHVFMRSSDLWLGLPYDIFNFSMLATLLVGGLNKHRAIELPSLMPGNLYLTAASSHIYSQHFELVKDITSKYVSFSQIEGQMFNPIKQAPVPELFYVGDDAQELLMDALDNLRNSDNKRDACRWWNHV